MLRCSECCRSSGRALIGFLLCLVATPPVFASSIDPSVQSAIESMQRDLASLRSYSGRVTVVASSPSTQEPQDPCVVKYAVAIGAEALRIRYELVKPSDYRGAGMPRHSMMHVSHTRYYDVNGAVTVEAGGAKRLPAEHQLSNWGQCEFVFAPNHFSTAVAGFNALPEAASSQPDFDKPLWNIGAAPGDKYARYLPVSPMKPLNRDFFTHHRRAIRFAKKYDYRPDLILTMTRGDDAKVLRECRVEWAECNLNGRRSWIPSKVHWRMFNPTQPLNSTTDLIPIFSLNVEIDVASASSQISGQMAGPSLPPPPPTRIVIDPSLRFETDKSGAIVSINKVASQSSGTHSLTKSNNSWRIASLTVLVVAGLIGFRLYLSRRRGEGR